MSKKRKKNIQSDKEKGDKGEKCKENTFKRSLFFEFHIFSSVSNQTDKNVPV